MVVVYATRRLVVFAIAILIGRDKVSLSRCSERLTILVLMTAIIFQGILELVVELATPETENDGAVEVEGCR